MPGRPPRIPSDPRQYQEALSTLENEGGALSHPMPQTASLGETKAETLPLTNVELVQLRIRVIALENLVITLLAEASDRQLALAREMAAYISPRPGFTHHPLTITAAAHMVGMVERVSRFRGGEST
ncbi:MULTISPECIES: hypothetical protein [unclassified Acidisoma]|uniref:hypothetical protein n=1 Tax=unclassified Acidisoma TaxID=2634065 RepID=UPI00131DAC24|nr:MULTISPECIES: hypothetical protein [unclassified Acidisoma]